MIKKVWPLGNDSLRSAFRLDMVSLKARGMGMSPTDLAARYREHAADCVKIAPGCSDPANKLSLLEMARSRLRLDHAEKNGTLTKPQRQAAPRRSVRARRRLSKHGSMRRRVALASPALCGWIGDFFVVVREPQHYPSSLGIFNVRG
jgi:hypothetical protein